MREFALFFYTEYLFKVRASTGEGAIEIGRIKAQAEIDKFNAHPDVVAKAEQWAKEAQEGVPVENRVKVPMSKLAIPNRAEVIEMPTRDVGMLPWHEQLKKQQANQAQEELQALIAAKDAASDRGFPAPPVAG